MDNRYYTYCHTVVMVANLPSCQKWQAAFDAVLRVFLTGQHPPWQHAKFAPWPFPFSKTNDFFATTMDSQQTYSPASFLSGSSGHTQFTSSNTSFSSGILLPFMTTEKVNSDVERQYDLLKRKKTDEQFIIYTDVTQDTVDRIGKDGTKASKLSRMSWDASSQELQLKVIPSPEHECSVGL